MKNNPETSEMIAERFLHPVGPGPVRRAGHRVARGDIVSAYKCTGGYRCPATHHVHGCYSDFGRCDHREEHGRDLTRHEWALVITAVVTLAAIAVVVLIALGKGWL